MSMKRPVHWLTREYHDFLHVRAFAPFAWGTNDCLMFAADGIMAIVGVDVAADFRGRYTDPNGALKTMRDVTGSIDMLTAVSAVAAKYGLQKRANALMAQRGDVVLVPEGPRLICALVGLSGRWVHAPGDDGLRNICITQAQHAWTY